VLGTGANNNLKGQGYIKAACHEKNLLTETQLFGDKASSAPVFTTLPGALDLNPSITLYIYDIDKLGAASLCGPIFY
jgi:hypothetical protein